MSTPAVPDGAPWHRLDARMLVVGPVNSVVKLLPIALLLLLTGRRGDPTQIWITVGLVVALIVAGVVRWRTTRYRIGDERVELRTGWLRRQRRSVPRDRIRTVDLTAPLLHRLFGLSVVHVSSAVGGGAGDSSARLDLDAVSKAEAERLRRVLLDRAPINGLAAERPAPPAPTELARLDWSWLRFAPLTVSSLAGIVAVAAAAFNLAFELRIDPRDIGVVADARRRFVEAPLWLGAGVVGLILLAIAVAGSMVLFAERWYGYRLTREPDGSLRVRRGLLTRRSLSVSAERLRGAEVTEPLLLRAGHGAQARALSTGLGEGGSGALQPPVPRDEAHRVAAVALRAQPSEVTRASLRPHPRAAMRRRLVRAVAPTAAIGALGWLVDPRVTVAALVLLPAAVLLAVDRFRGLGHTVTERHVVTRTGGLRRRTVALQRDGVIGWTFRQSVFQRRAGVVTAEVVTAAGRGGYPVLDADTIDAVTFADDAAPGLLAPFRTDAHHTAQYSST